MVLPCTSELCNYISYQVETVRSQSTNQFIGSITTVARHVGVSIPVRKSLEFKNLILVIRI